MGAVAVTGTFAGTSYFYSDVWPATLQVLLKPALVAVLFPLTGFTSSTSIAWANDPQYFVSPTDAAAVFLKVRSYKTRGIDDIRSDMTSGLRDVCISIRAEAYNLSAEAPEILNAVVTGLMTQATSTALNAIGLSFMKANAMTEGSFSVDDRAVSVATCDVWLNGIINVIPAPGGIGNILTVNSNNIVPGTITS